MSKKCSKCKEEFPSTTEYFRPHSGTKSGLNSQCRPCLKETQKKYRQSPKGKNTIAKGIKKYRETPKGLKCKAKYNKKWDMKLGKGVYGLFEGTKCLYIGESSRLNRRKYEHSAAIKNPQTVTNKCHHKLYDQLSTNHTNIKWKILEQCDNHKERERYFIDMYNPIYNNI